MQTYWTLGQRHTRAATCSNLARSNNKGDSGSVHDNTRSRITAGNKGLKVGSELALEKRQIKVGIKVQGCGQKDADFPEEQK